MVYFTADTHFGHTNIITYCKRPFASNQEMDRAIIANFRKILTPEDLTYFIGDFTLSRDPLYTARLLQAIPGRKVLILGNHDKLPPFAYIDAGFESVHTSLLITGSSGNPIFLAHDPATAVCVDKIISYMGHVHTLFKKQGNVINVGVDIWDFKPVTEKDLTNLP